MDDDTKAKVIEDEYLQLQKMVEDFDGKALTIKAWSVTLSAAGIVTAYVQTKPVVLIVTAFSALAFWIVEALWKANQQAFYARIYEIENAFSEGIASLKPLQIATSWSKSWHGNGQSRRALTIMLWPHVFMPHLLVAIAGLAFYWIAPPGP